MQSLYRFRVLSCALVVFALLTSGIVGCFKTEASQVPASGASSSASENSQAPAQIRIRWVADTTEITRVQLEAKYSLRRLTQINERSWNYSLVDVSTGNIRALVNDPNVEDTSGIDRTNSAIAGR